MHQLKRVTPTTTAKALDQYFTKPEVVELCLSQVGDLSRYDLVIEPSAGDGAFLNAIEHERKVGLDIDPRHKDVKQADWLEYQITDKARSVLVVGNPPYGQYHKLSSAFIKHAMSFPNLRTIAFILPNVYRKHTRQRIIPKQWRIASVTDLGKNCFTLDGEDYHVPASFFVIDRSSGTDLRVNVPDNITGTEDFDFAKPEDFDVFVFGASPKRVITNPTSNNRGYYLKSKVPVETLVKRIKSVNWNGNSCANGGVYWLTKLEFISQYKECHQSKRDGNTDPIRTGQSTSCS